MQKKFIALAVAGLVSGAAFAQSNVTIYGVADVGFENVSATGATANGVGVADTSVNLPSRSRIESNSSYIGFKGSEALGNGLTAVFQIETQFAIDNAQNGTAGSTANTLANRDSFAGLAGGFGTVIAGYLSTPYRSMGAKFDVMPGATGAAGFNGLVGHINIGASKAANGTTTNTFSTAAGTVNNFNGIGRSQAIAYVTPTFSGFSAVAAYTSNENKAVDQNNAAAATVTTAKLNPSAWNVAANYDNGPLSLGYSYLKGTDLVAVVAANNAGTGVSSDAKAHLLAARYVFNGATTVSAMWNQTTASINNVGANAMINEYKTNVWYLGLKHVVGQHEFAGMYARAADGSVNNSNGFQGSATDRGAQQYGLRYGYNFSKRTQAYALWTRIDNKSNGNYDFGNGNAASNSNNFTTTTLSAGADPQVFGAGLRHSF
jgi:predicted porin